MAESASGKVIVLHFADELVSKWNPFGGALGRPPAWPARRVAAETDLPALLLLGKKGFEGR